MIIDDKMSSEKEDIIKEQAEDEMDTGISWAVLMVAFFGQAMSVGFYYCYGILYVEIVEAYAASDRQAGICFIIPLSKLMSQVIIIVSFGHIQDILIAPFHKNFWNNLPI